MFFFSPSHVVDACSKRTGISIHPRGTDCIRSDHGVVVVQRRREAEMADVREWRTCNSGGRTVVVAAIQHLLLLLHSLRSLLCFFCIFNLRCCSAARKYLSFDALIIGTPETQGIGSSLPGWSCKRVEIPEKRPCFCAHLGNLR